MATTTIEQVVEDLIDEYPVKSVLLEESTHPKPSGTQAPPLGSQEGHIKPENTINADMVMDAEIISPSEIDITYWKKHI